MSQNLTLPVLPLRDAVLFPRVTVPIGAGRPGTVRAVEAALATKWPVIARIKPAPVDADRWAEVKDKRALLDRRGPAEAAPAEPAVAGRPGEPRCD